MLTSTKATYNTSFEFATVQCSNDLAQQQEHDLEHDVYDVLKNTLREQRSAILDILLIDRTSKKNIIWANEHYIDYNKEHYAATAHVKPELITGKMCQLIMPRALKSKEQQKQRTKSKAEVFTPTWIIKKQNNALEQDYLNDDVETYVRRKWLEISCGEAPYMATRYDMATGETIPLAERVGFVDRKLKRINADIDDKAEWQRLVEEAYKASYGFEWNGDSLLLARENFLYTYQDFYVAKWQQQPTNGLLKEIAEIISYNVFQMDGLKYIIPLSEKKEKIPQTSFSFSDDEPTQEQWLVQAGKRVKIMNWDKKKMEFFDKGVK